MYVTPQDLIDEFGIEEMVELTDLREPRTYELDTAVAQRACDRADAEVDAHLAGRYKLPLASTPTQLQFLARDLARFYLYHGEPATVVKSRYETARQMLRDIQAGRQSLGLDTLGAAVQATPADLPMFDTGAKAWGRET